MQITLDLPAKAAGPLAAAVGIEPAANDKATITAALEAFAADVVHDAEVNELRRTKAAEAEAAVAAKGESPRDKRRREREERQRPPVTPPTP